MNVNKKKLISIQIISIFLFIFIIASASYAFFSAKITQTNQSFSGTAANIELVIDAPSPMISGTNIFPGWQSEQTFTVRNGGGNTFYTLYLKDIQNTFTIDDSISYELISTNGGGNVAKSTLPASGDKDIKLGILIPSDTTHTYTIKVYYNNLNDSDQSPDKGKSFSFELGFKTANTGVAGGTNPA